jgi:hypothetical protein
VYPRSFIDAGPVGDGGGDGWVGDDCAETDVEVDTASRVGGCGDDGDDDDCLLLALLRSHFLAIHDLLRARPVTVGRSSTERGSRGSAPTPVRAGIAALTDSGDWPASAAALGDVADERTSEKGDADPSRAISPPPPPLAGSRFDGRSRR